MHKHTSRPDRDREERELQVYKRAGPESSGAVPVFCRQECIPMERAYELEKRLVNAAK